MFWSDPVPVFEVRSDPGFFSGMSDSDQVCFRRRSDQDQVFLEGRIRIRFFSRMSDPDPNPLLFWQM